MREETTMREYDDFGPLTFEERAALAERGIALPADDGYGVNLSVLGCPDCGALLAEGGVVTTRCEVIEETYRADVGETFALVASKNRGNLELHGITYECGACGADLSALAGTLDELL